MTRSDVSLSLPNIVGDCDMVSRQHFRFALLIAFPIHCPGTSQAKDHQYVQYCYYNAKLVTVANWEEAHDVVVNNSRHAFCFVYLGLCVYLY